MQHSMNCSCYVVLLLCIDANTAIDLALSRSAFFMPIPRHLEFSRHFNLSTFYYSGPMDYGRLSNNAVVGVVIM